ncbi:unnamed protein product [Paramecium primaurelia]|uniref:Uncharacterized protein n=1 Tax=Paramecium primaurelia TaxID=5886 RepID=A0A8S1L3J7_PARPR|nr:unnamed protein product [Paramecium primaurelia]
MIIKDDNFTIGSISFPYKLLKKQLNLINLFDPKDYQQDDNFIKDDQEQLRILLRIDNIKFLKNSQLPPGQLNQKEYTLFLNDKQIIVNNRGSQGKQNKYSSLKEDILPFTDMFPSEIIQLEQEKQSYKKNRIKILNKNFKIK